ncbi:hypothetical protein SAMN05443661_102205 [Natronobacterium gregoryi]|uniref:Uncharacterized protein n=2 Tax=Natronobacterium gregoryi TaxID=44930 RepID=L0AGX2_NATGS|nr:hypothetical protein Natgr_1876 [Natronobacterium gregoryi SP2]SFI62285.1 hypothetical protein SAMN05443661_102205 [Natronobacterium gregoryi]
MHRIMAISTKVAALFIIAIAPMVEIQFSIGFPAEWTRFRFI